MVGMMISEIATEVWDLKSRFLAMLQKNQRLSSIFPVVAWYSTCRHLSFANAGSRVHADSLLHKITVIAPLGISSFRHHHSRDLPAFLPDLRAMRLLTSTVSTERIINSIFILCNSSTSLKFIHIFSAPVAARKTDEIFPPHHRKNSNLSSLTEWSGQCKSYSGIEAARPQFIKRFFLFSLISASDE